MRSDSVGIFTMNQQAFVIDRGDNVATALADLRPGAVGLVGVADRETVDALEEIRSGHKLALCDLATGDPVIKYGKVIGLASRAIARGTWVHLHNLASQFDERSATLDAETGSPTESDVYV